MQTHAMKHTAPALVFDGLTARQAKRRALAWWYGHQPELNGIGVSEFFAHCRMTRVGGVTRITYYTEPPAA